MATLAHIETSPGEHIPLLDSQGVWRGGALAKFFFVATGHCLPKQSDANEDDVWFSELGRHSENGICELLQPLINAWYYNTEENSGANTNWLDTKQALTSILELRRMFGVASLPPVYWFDHQATTIELGICESILTSAVENGVTAVRFPVG
jgi:hypothetical protein